MKYYYNPNDEGIGREISGSMFNSHHWEYSMSIMKGSKYYTCPCGAQSGVHPKGYHPRVNDRISIVDKNGVCPYTEEDILVKDIVE